MNQNTTDFNEAKIEQTVKAYCDARLPDHVKDKLWYEYILNEREVILVECRPYWKDKKQTTRSEFAKNQLRR